MANTAQALAANQSTSSATPVNTALVAPLEANKVYWALGYWRAVANGASIRFAFTAPAGTTVTGWHTGFASSATSEANREEITALATVSTNTNSNAANVGSGHFWVRVQTSATPGNLTLQIATSAGGTAVVIQAGSWWTVDELTAGAL